jgi:hypothetical protein
MPDECSSDEELEILLRRMLAESPEATHSSVLLFALGLIYESKRGISISEGFLRRGLIALQSALELLPVKSEYSIAQIEEFLKRPLRPEVEPVVPKSCWDHLLETLENDS